MVERMISQRFALALDLVEDAQLIAEYEAWHQPGRTPAPIIRSIRDAGIQNMEIYRAGNPVPAAGPGGSWLEVKRVFRLTDHADD
jgi:L-rhamnose mutarotase